MTMKLKDAGINVEDSKVKKDIERLVGKTEGYTFDFVKEVVQGIYVDEIDETALFDRLNEIIKKNGKVIISEEKSKKIGFTSEGSQSNKNKLREAPQESFDEPIPGYGEDDDEGWAEQGESPAGQNEVTVHGFTIGKGNSND